MAIIKKTDAMPERPVIIVLFGIPGSGKTSIATTAENPLLIDCDRGADRAVQRCDTLVADRWTDILQEAETMKDYKTIIIDTAKSMLDDFLSAYVIEQNYKLKTNALKRFGQMADEFKAFVEGIRKNHSNIIFICHDRETAEGDVIKHSPDCTGQSKDLLLRISDQVGYLNVINNKRCVSFEPTDTIVGKNVARIPLTEIPDVSDSRFTTLMEDIIKGVQKAIRQKTEAQAKALELIEELRETLQAATTDEDIDFLIKRASELPKANQKSFFTEMKRALAVKGFTYDSKAKKFVKETPKEEEGEPLTLSEE